jgi:MYXO-CTERM domain-containing protein
MTINLPVGTQITGAEWIDLTFTALGASWQSEMVLSINDSIAGPAFWDYNPGTGVDTPGTFGPSTGVFANPGLFSSGPFTMASSTLYIETYESFNDGGNTVQDASIASGTLRITYTPVPTPGAVALLGLGGLVATRRRR